MEDFVVPNEARNISTKTTVFNWNNTWKREWNICQNPEPRYRHLQLETWNGKIMIYAFDNTDYISRTINQTNQFEPNIDKIIYTFLKMDEKMSFIDIGANIGHRSLIVAKMQRQVLSVEALDINVKLFCASVYVNMLEDNITIVHNAIGNKHEIVRMAKHKNSYGSSFVDRADMRNRLGGLVLGTFNNSIYSITFKDLLQLDVIKHFKKVFIKMDIEGFENRALEGALEFFKQVEVVGIIMEWRFHRNSPSGVQIISIMRNLGFIPYKDDVVTLAKLDYSINASISWPHDVLWINENFDISRLM